MAKKTTKTAPAPKKTIRKAAAEEKAAASSKAEKAKVKAKPVEEEAPAMSEDSDEDEAMLVSVSTSASVSMTAGPGGAMGGPTLGEGASGVRSFRHHPEIENFYRFIYENDLRYEALAIIEEILHEKKARKGLQMKKSKAH